MFKFLRKNNTIDGNWLKVSDLKVGMQIAVPKDYILGMHQMGTLGNISSAQRDEQNRDGGDVLWDEIESIEYVGTEQVWDIEVEDTHNFVGNNIFAHNTYLDGNLGIGTSNPGANLEIKNAAVSGLNKVLQLGQTLYGTSESGTYIDFAVSSSVVGGAQIGGIRELAAGTGTSALIFKTGAAGSPTEWMRIASSGAVTLSSLTTAGVVTTTAAGVLGSVAILPSAKGGSGINNTGTLTWGNGGTLGTNAYNSTAFISSLSGALLETGATTGATSQSQTFTNGVTMGSTGHFYTSSVDIYANVIRSRASGLAIQYAQATPSDVTFYGGGATPQVTFKTDGSVGIGTTDPAQKLDVAGNIRLTSDGSVKTIEFYDSNTNYGGPSVVSAINGFNVSDHSNGILTLSTMNSGSLGERMRINNAGNVGIGTTNPLNQLHVDGTDPVLLIKDVRTSSTVGNATLRLAESGANGAIGEHWDIKAAPLGPLQFIDAWEEGGGMGTRMVISDAGAVGIMTLAGSGNRAVYSDPNGNLTNVTSDARLKKDVVTISNEIDVIASLNKLRGVYYNWDTSIDAAKNLGSQREIGMIAQEVELVLPELVGTNATGFKSLDYSKMTGFLIEVTKIQQAEIEGMNLKLGALTGEIIPVAGSDEETFMNNFFANLFVKVGDWLAKADNGIKTIFARKISTRLLCIADEAGVETCVEKTQLDNLLANAGVASASDTTDVSGVSTDTPAVTTINPNAPVITLVGNATINLNIGDVYNELGANVTDDVDTFVSAVITGVPDTSANGIYAIHYNAVDSEGNNAIELIRQIIVGTGEYTLTGVSTDWSPTDTGAIALPSTGETTTTITDTSSSTTLPTIWSSIPVTSIPDTATSGN